MLITIIPTKSNRLITDFEVLSKIGEGSFGEAFKVRSRQDGMMYAVKKAKQKYIGFKDREQKLSEVYKSLKISSSISNSHYAQYCLKTFEAWEEGGYLFIRSELCDKGNLNEYLIELEKQQESQLLIEDQVWKFLL
jgi:membrane-associated tyrosine/threonine-specific cdc2-inhibitory kinase